MQTLLQGDIDAGRAAIRDYINATVGFEKLSAALGKPQKSLMRMFGPTGNPTAENLFGVIGVASRDRRASQSARCRRRSLTNKAVTSNIVIRVTRALLRSPLPLPPAAPVLVSISPKRE